jgi:hypothetical protein
VTAPEAKTETPAPSYPECEKLAAVHTERMAIAEFVEWGRDLGLVSVRGNADDVIMEYLGINTRVLEAERRDMLDKLRKAQP